MIELIVFAVVVSIVVAVLGLVGALLSFVFWLILLPFKLLALAGKALGLLVALPFLLLLGLIVLVTGGIGVLFLLGPLLPIVLVVAALVWLVRKPGRSRATVNG